MDTASLRIAINTGDIKTANAELDKLTKTSARTEQSANKVTKSFNLMNTALSSVAAIAIAKHFTDSADAMNRLDGRLKLATDSMGEFVRQQHALQKIALDSHAPLQAVTDLFIKLNPSMIRLGANTDATNQVVSNFSKGLTLGGAKAQESASAILQFGQAMGSGVLRGEEFNAILEASPKLMEYMARGMNVPIGSLREMAANGELTAGRVSNALLKMTDQINKDFATLPKTVGLAMVDFNTELDLAIQRIDKATGTTAALSSAINDMTMGLKNGTGILGGTIAFVQEYDEVIKGVAVSLAVMYTATKAATLAELLYSNAKSKTTIATNASTASIITNMGVTRSLTTAQTAGAVASTALGTAMKAVPFVAVASTVAILAASFFEAKKDSDDLANSLDVTADKLAKLTKNQLEYQKTVLFNATQELAAELRAAEAGAREKGIFQSKEDYQKELSDLDGLKNKLKETREAYRTTRDFKLPSGTKSDSKIVPPTNIAPIDKKAEAAAKKAAKEAEKLAEEQADIKRGYLEGYADLQAQKAIDQYELELSQIEDLAKRESDLAVRFYDIVTPEIDKINEKNKELYEFNKDLFSPEQMQTFFEKWQESIDNIKSEMDFSSSIEFDPSAMDGTAKAIAGISKSMSQLAKAEAQYQKNKAKTGATTEDLKKNEEDYNKSQIAGYSNLAGSMSTFFEEGTKGAKAFQIVQSGLAVVNAVSGIAAQSSLPFPYNIAAMAGTAATVFSFLSAAGITGGGGGGGGSPVPTENFEQNRTDIENTYSPMTDRLDRQIELLESIDKNGSASQLGVELAGTTFRRDYSLWVEDTLEKARLIADSSMTVAETYGAVARVEQMAGVDIYKPVSAARVELNTSSLRESYNLINALVSSLEMGWGTFGQADSILGSEGVPRELASIRNSINELQNITHEWAMGVIESMDDIKSASKDFKTYYDEITGSMYYETNRLNQAYSDINVLKGTRSFADYLKDTITNMDALQKFFTEETFALLMSDNVNDIQNQIAAIDRLSAITGETFSGGAKDALNYLESIQLVAESMKETSDNIDSLFGNIQSFIDDLSSNSVSDPSSTFYAFTSSFNEMVDAIAMGSSDLVEVGNVALDNAKNYLDVVKSTATAGRDVEFARAMLINKFSGVIATPDTTLNTINGTLNANNQALLAELRANKFELDSIKELMLSSNNYQKQISMNTQTSRFIGA